uniref:Large ribosomal subunit protein mL49 n=1 Tax=Plectus sambesii TaxID=2011161 RepID=A0A914WJH5_9BILA
MAARNFASMAIRNRLYCKSLSSQSFLRRCLSSSSESNAVSSVGKLGTSQEEPKIWEDPWRHALGPPPPPEEYTTEFEESSAEWKFVERLFPHDVIPEPPKHESYPTPSGWRPPRDPAPNLPYFIRRLRNHMLPLFLESRRDQLNLETMDYDYVELVKLKNVQGDVFACERDLRAYLESKVGHSIATHVNELQGAIRVKGVERADVERFLFEQGF